MKTIEIVTFDVPFPADYGGAMDVFHKIRAFRDLGWRVTLHCFVYADRQRSLVLEDLCEKVFYYHRKMSPPSIRRFFFSKMPYIVASRADNLLLERLKNSENPILMEGLHTTAFAETLRHAAPHRKLLLRMHNVEWQYYAALQKLEKKIFKRQYFRLESARLRSWEQRVLPFFDHVFCIAPNDIAYFESNFSKNAPPPVFHHFPPFHEADLLENSVGKGNFVLFHGKLSVSDNALSAQWLVENVFSQLHFPCVIAGMNAPTELKNLISRYENIILIENPNAAKMRQLQRDAHVHALWSFQPSGMKLKLLNAVFSGRWVVGNSCILENTGLENVCVLADDAKKYRAAIKSLLDISFDEKNKMERAYQLKSQFYNHENIKKITKILAI